MERTRFPRLEVALQSVTSEDDVTALAEINDLALEGDPLKTWMVMFTERSEYESTVKAVREALTDPTYRLVKAVIPHPADSTKEKIVGFCHWLEGYIVLDKVDPFAKKPELASGNQKEVPDVKDLASNIAEDLEAKAQTLQSQDDADRAARLRIGEAIYVTTRNHYIASIRGKKHMFIRRLMTLPEYQGRGVASQLLKVVTDEADRQKIVCWLNSRPAGEPLYKKVGFQVIAETMMDEPEYNLQVPRTCAMLRLPQSIQ